MDNPPTEEETVEVGHELHIAFASIESAHDRVTTEDCEEIWPGETIEMEEFENALEHVIKASRYMRYVHPDYETTAAEREEMLDYLNRYMATKVNHPKFSDEA